MSFLVHLYAARWWLASVVFLAYATSKYRAYKRLAAFKGPFSTGWSEVWHTYHILNRRAHLAYFPVNDKYGEFLCYFVQKEV
jgi:hypothetical protein